MKEKYVKPTCQIITLPEEEFFTASIVSYGKGGDNGLDPIEDNGLRVLSSGRLWTGNSDGQGTNWFD